jgi:ATP-dependent protease ClpP protease subunit
MLELSAKLPRDAVIYLVLDTPGGEIEAGSRFIDAAHGIPQKVKTITLFAASMGYHIAQELDERLITVHGTLMSHRAKAGEISGEIPGNLVTRVNALLRDLDLADARIARRLGMSLEDYKEMIRDEYWVVGPDAVEQRSADGLANIHCAPDLQGTEIITVNTIFGAVDVTLSKCPAISGPLGIAIHNDVPKDKQKEVRDIVTKMLTDKETFVHEYITTGQFAKVLR